MNKETKCDHKHTRCEKKHDLEYEGAFDVYYIDIEICYCDHCGKVIEIYEV